MRNQFHYRARIDRLWRRANGPHLGHVQLSALQTILQELFTPNERARHNYQMYLATDPFDVARHHLRDLYDQPTTEVAPAKAGAPTTTQGDPTTEVGPGAACPALDVGAGATLLEDEPSEEDDEPL